MQSRSPLVIDSNQFLVEGESKSGHYGQVFPVIYRGNENPDINELGNLILKRGEVVKDCEIAEYLRSQSAHKSAAKNFIDVGLPIEVQDPEGNYPAILSTRANYSANKSSNLLNYVSDAVNNSDPNFSGIKLAETFLRLMDGMKTSQDMLHQMRVYHVDTGLRNFMLLPNLGVKLIDYGLSMRMVDGQLPPTLNNVKYPLRSMDVNSLNQQGVSILTDLFALRSTMIELIGAGAGLTLDQVLNIRDAETPLQYALTRRDIYLTDDKAFAEVIIRLKTLLTPDKPNAQMCLKILEAMQPYLEHMPQHNIANIASFAETDAVRQQDKKMLNQALHNLSMVIAKEKVSQMQLQTPSSTSTREIMAKMQSQPKAAASSSSSKRVEEVSHYSYPVANTGVLKLKIKFIQAIIEQEHYWRKENGGKLPSGVEKFIKELKGVNPEALTSAKIEKHWSDVLSITHTALKSEDKNDSPARKFYEAILANDHIQLAKISILIPQEINQKTVTNRK